MTLIERLRSGVYGINRIEMDKEAADRIASLEARTEQLEDALVVARDQLRLTNINLYKGMSRSIQSLQARENHEALAKLNALISNK